MIELWGKDYTREELLRRVGDMRQVAGVEPFELTDGSQRGVRAVRLWNAAGLNFTVAAERGMSLTNLTWRGVPIPFLSAVGTVHPAYYEPEGLGWLRTWPVGFLTPCGLTQAGAPCSDDGEQLGLHGRVAHIPAQNIHWGAEWRGEEYYLWVEADVRETAVFGANLLLHRRISTTLTSPTLWIEDRIENQGFSASPHLFMQHINIGHPLIDSTTSLDLPERITVPSDENARLGLEQCCSFGEPLIGCEEQVFFHELTPDDDGNVEVRLVNPAFANGAGLGMCLRYALKAYPVLTEWKMMREGLYVVGVEPGNCRSLGRARIRENGDLPILGPGETRNYHLEITFFTNQG